MSDDLNFITCCTWINSSKINKGDILIYPVLCHNSTQVSFVAFLLRRVLFLYSCLIFNTLSISKQVYLFVWIFILQIFIRFHLFILHFSIFSFIHFSLAKMSSLSGNNTQIKHIFNIIRTLFTLCTHFTLSHQVSDVLQPNFRCFAAFCRFPCFTVHACFDTHHWWFRHTKTCLNT